MSDRLSESPACLVAPEFGPDLRLQQILSSHGQAASGLKPVLEINPSHPLVIALEKQAASGDKSLFEDAVWLLFDEARAHGRRSAARRRRFRGSSHANSRQSSGSLSLHRFKIDFAAT